MPRWVTRYVVSDTLIIKACNTDAGSGGVAREMNLIAKRTKQRAIALSPVNNPLNARSPGHHAPGLYRRSFKRKRSGNQHILTRTIYNDAPHAGAVEGGRRSTRFGNEAWANFHPTGFRAKHGKRAGQRFMYINDAPMKAAYAWEFFSWTGGRPPGKPMWFAGSAGYKGQSVLERAFKWSTKKYTVSFVRGKKGYVPGNKVWR